MPLTPTPDFDFNSPHERERHGQGPKEGICKGRGRRANAYVDAGSVCEIEAK